MLRVPPYIVWNAVEGELALFDSRTGQHHALNRSAATLWRAIAAGDAPDAIVARLATDHGVDPAVVRADFDVFVTQASAIGLLVADDGH